jgi:hypothetical protein
MFELAANPVPYTVTELPVVPETLLSVICGVTVKVVEISGEDPAIEMICAPTTVLGTVIVAVYTLATAADEVPAAVPSKLIITMSPVVAAPVTIAVEPTAPLVGFIDVIDVPAASAGAKIPRQATSSRTNKTAANLNSLRMVLDPPISVSIVCLGKLLYNNINSSLTNIYCHDYSLKMIAIQSPII